MFSSLIIFLCIINAWRVFPVFCAIHLSKNKELIIEELIYWSVCSKMPPKNNYYLLSQLLIRKKEYRNLLYYRLRYSNFFGAMLIRILFPRLESLYLSCSNIGKCLYIQHGFATQISAKSIGEYCWINQQVTIGYSFDNDPPVIGNGVRISAGAKVLGNIYIGDNAIIGANAVVVKDVDACAIVGGVPANNIGINKDHKLYCKA